MNSLQKKQFHLLNEFVRICEKLNLRYYLVCGTALGAKKYGGFIPWDDDLDVAMPREDYNLFIEVAQAELPEGIFLQNYLSDPNFPQIYSKLRDSNTTYIEKTAAHLKMNHGIFIDVFPLDGYPQNALYRLCFEFRKRLFDMQLLSFFNIPCGRIKKIRNYFLRKLSFNSQRIAHSYTRMISKFPTKGSALLCNHGNWQGKLEYAPAEQYGEGNLVIFEGFSFNSLAELDKYLRQKYGNYHNDPPDDKKVGHHYCTVCDCDKSYRFYLEEFE